MNWIFEDFSKCIKRKRLTNDWYYFSGIVNNKTVRLKGYKTYLQIYEVDGVRYGGLCDITVKQFNAELAKPFEELKCTQKQHTTTKRDC